MSIIRQFAVVAAFALIPALFAHDLYLMPEAFVTAPGTELRVVYQNGDEFPEGVSAVKPERLRNTQLRSRSGSAPFENITAEAARTVASVRVPASGSAILTSQTIPNFIELDPAKFKSYLEHENLTNVLEWRRSHGETERPGRERYSKYVKSLIVAEKADSFFQTRTGLTVEIVPEADPYQLKPGDVLPVQVLFRGKPAIDVAVESAWLINGKSNMQVVGRTDSAGRVRVPVRATGPHRLHAIVMERCAEPKVADWESFWASLTFEIQPQRQPCLAASAHCFPRFTCLADPSGCATGPSQSAGHRGALRLRADYFCGKRSRYAFLHSGQMAGLWM